MLKQILENMYIDPELLEMLSTDDKELLFRKMREEQVRRWKLREEKLEIQERRYPPKKTPRKVKIMLGADKQPWVWVMGEAPGDLPYEELVKKCEQEELKKQELEDRRKAEELAMIESQALLIDPLLNINNNNHEVVDKDLSTEQRDVLSPLSSPVKKRLSVEDIEVIQKQRAEELFTSFKNTRDKVRKRSEQLDLAIEQVWEDQEKKAKSFESKRKESFIKARERLKSDSQLPELVLEKLPDEKKAAICEKMKRTLSSGAISRYHYAPKHLPRVELFTNNPTGTRPKSREAVVKWFRNIEKPKGVGIEPNGTISEWMHGVISRADTDELLHNMPLGSFLVRVSVKIWGYTVSVKCRLGIQHFMIESYKNHYQFSGGDSMKRFSSLKELLDYHQTTPISQAGGELLEIPCGQLDNEMPDYKELYKAVDSDSDDSVNVAGTDL